MGASIRGHMSQIKILKNGGQTEVVNITSFNVNQDSSFTRSFYVGQQYGEGDQSMDGWSGSMDAEVKDSKIDDLIDSLVTGNLNGIGVDDVTIVDTESYTDGTEVAYVYFGIQLKMSKTIGGQNAKSTKKLDWQADGRLKL